MFFRGTPSPVMCMLLNPHRGAKSSRNLSNGTFSFAEVPALFNSINRVCSKLLHSDTSTHRSFSTASLKVLQACLPRDASRKLRRPTILLHISGGKTAQAFSIRMLCSSTISGDELNSPGLSVSGIISCLPSFLVTHHLQGFHISDAKITIMDFEGSDVVHTKLCTKVKVSRKKGSVQGAHTVSLERGKIAPYDSTCQAARAGKNSP